MKHSQRRQLAGIANTLPELAIVGVRELCRRTGRSHQAVECYLRQLFPPGHGYWFTESDARQIVTYIRANSRSAHRINPRSLENLGQRGRRKPTMRRESVGNA